MDVSWEKGNHSTDGLWKGSSGQPFSLSGVRVAAPKKISMLPQPGTSECDLWGPESPYLCSLLDHALLRGTRAPPLALTPQLLFCSCGCPIQHSDLTFPFLCTSQAVFQECSSALAEICHLLINSVPDGCQHPKGIREQH